MERSLLLAGFGGQGIMIIGKTLCYVANATDKSATFYPAYGTAQRGGTANCTVIIGDDKIGSPVCETYDDLILMNEPSYVKFAPSLKKGGTMIVNSSMVTSRPAGNVRCIPVDSVAIATKLGNEKVANMVILGAYVGLTGNLDLDDVKAMVRKSLGKKVNLIDLNMQAIDAGIAAVAQCLAA